MLEQLKTVVCQANQRLVQLNLVQFTWGNVSGWSPDHQLLVIKPSGVAYDCMMPEDMVVMDLEGKVVEGRLKPSSDAPTHIQLYKHWPDIGGIVHTHSKWGTIFAQARQAIPVLGTTHADHFYGEIPCSIPLDEDAVRSDYESNTGRSIIETFYNNGLDHNQIPGIVVGHHAPFTWGEDVMAAVENAAVLEYCAEMAYHTLALSPHEVFEPYLLNKHYLRKHGQHAYYGQTK